ncbi:hypothetical protein DFA_11859 [Cavenderia fasciculata]|uniref:Uncharacterized protein n=1 Tax=Cavenderia fasciculata TaxID=261658 RepID=F4QEI4_CACFS|nr:uncharacterized protein DFA_11859 [Cavenderia fasciculata]EGG14095.1 hypothetical protein DFA_11859 [Cavenderia fasciculata]|eukprot:XP_004350803.1 hypothetical protein DFA_11859 [Cavenderia fasciculata]
MSSSFEPNPIHLCQSKNDWLDFQKEFYQLAMTLNFVNKNIQSYMDQRVPLHLNLKTKIKPMKSIS